VIGTRYGEGVAIDENWPLHRRVISKGARLLGVALTPLSDPMTGFFGIRRDVVCLCCWHIACDSFHVVMNLSHFIFILLVPEQILHNQFARGKNINPIGFKIALELYVKCGCTRPTEVPFSFGVRIHGES
jgi:dolichol-phosphate mannosyltransferase